MDVKEPHFHIRWSAKNHLDWERFNSPSEAMTRAVELSRPGEMFTIEECYAEVPQCGPKAASERNQNPS
jgi:hypothetical protein